LVNRDIWFFFLLNIHILGPKLLTAFTALSLARDEIVWLLRHSENFPAKLQKETNKKTAGTTRDDYSDRTYPEFLFYIGKKFILFISMKTFFFRGTSSFNYNLFIYNKTILY
jgi:hypothetical protein